MISNKKSEIPHVAAELLHNPRLLLRAVLTMVAYLLAYIILDFITRQFEVIPGIVAWYPPAGLTYVLLLVFGVRFAPAVTIALFLSSLLIYRFPQPPYQLFLWALIISLIYSGAAMFLRHRIHLNWQLQKLRDVVWFVSTTVLVSAMLAILTVSGSALSSNMPQNEVLWAIFNWWIGETVGVLTVTPFMLIYVIPTLKRFTEGQPIRFPAGWSFPRPTLSIIIQWASLAFTLYWVFGAPVPEEFRPLFLIALPLIWIALQRGLKGASAAILLMNTGVMISVWLFRFGSAKLADLELLMIITCVVGLLMGAVVTDGKQAEKALRYKDELLHITSEMAKVGGWEFDALTLEGTWTDEVARIHDLDPTYPTSVNLGNSFYIPDSRIKIEQAIKEAIESKQPYDLELQMISAKGNQKWVRTMGLPIIEDGKVIKIRGIFQDITERKQAEQILHENEQRLSSIYDSVGDVIYYLKVEPDEQYRFDSVNPAFIKVTGLPAEQVIGMKVSEIIPEPSLSMVLGKYRQAIQEKCIVRWEETSDYPTGRLVGDVSIAPVFDEAGNCTHLVGSVHDITGSKRADGELVLANKELVFQNEDKEKRAAELILANKELAFQNEEKGKRAVELTENKTLLASVLDSSLSGIMAFKSIRNAEGAIMDFEWQMVNAAAEQMVSRSQAEIVGKRLLEDMPGNREEGLFDLYVRVVETGIPMSHEHYYEHEKVKTWFHTVAIKRFDGFVVTFSNITERKLAEHGLITANKELLFQNEEKEKRAAELITANKELLFQNEEKGKRAAELITANKELLFQNEEKEKRAAELVIANKELAFQNEEKGKRAAELIIANKELAFQNEEKEKRAAELITANKELIFQNDEKEKRAAELILASEETTHQLQNIQALFTIDQAITSSLDLNLTLNVILEQVKTQLNVDAAAVLLLNPHTQILGFANGIGFRGKVIERSRLHLGEGYGGLAALERMTVSVTNLLENDTHFIAPLLADEGFNTYFATPLIAKGQVNGILEVYHRSPFAPDENWLKFFKLLAGQTAIAVDSASLFTELTLSNAQLFMAYDSTIEGWSHALDLRDKETEGHTQRVTEMTMKLAHAVGITEEELVHVRRGALLHDIGKMGVPDHILLKPGKLTDEEWVAMRKHTTFAFELLSPIAYLRPAIDIPYCHHEKWDGSGYPRGLKGEQIPLAARLFAIVDVWDALTSDRPYRKAWSHKQTLEYIRDLSGIQFDPKIVNTFIENMAGAELSTINLD